MHDASTVVGFCTARSSFWSHHVIAGSFTIDAIVGSFTSDVIAGSFTSDVIAGSFMITSLVIYIYDKFVGDVVH